MNDVLSEFDTLGGLSHLRGAIGSVQREPGYVPTYPALFAAVLSVTCVKARQHAEKSCQSKVERPVPSSFAGELQGIPSWAAHTFEQGMAVREGMVAPFGSTESPKRLKIVPHRGHKA